MFFFLWKKKKEKASRDPVLLRSPTSNCRCEPSLQWVWFVNHLFLASPHWSPAGRQGLRVRACECVCVWACKRVCGSARACERLTWCTAERLLGLCCASIYLRSLFQTSNSGEKVWPWEELSSLTNTNASHDTHTHTKTHPLFNCTQDDTKSLTLAVVIMPGWFHFVSVQRKALRR